jgi:hypothetical protein
MVPCLVDSQHQLIRDIILSELLRKVETANVAGRSDWTIRITSSNVRPFGKMKVPADGAGQQRLLLTQTDRLTVLATHLHRRMWVQ